MQFGGQKQPPTTPAMLHRPKKACECSQSLGAGLHKQSCRLHPMRLKATLEFHEQNRDSVKKQLSKTSLAPVQVEAALLHLFGRVCSFSSSSGLRIGGTDEQIQLGMAWGLPLPILGNYGRGLGARQKQGWAGVGRGLGARFRSPGPNRAVISPNRKWETPCKFQLDLCICSPDSLT